MKGVTLTTEWLVKIIGAFFFLFLAIAILTLIGGKIPGTKIGCDTDFAKYLPWCKSEEPSTYEDESAENSVKALACAISSVAKGELTQTTCPDASPGRVTAGFLPSVYAQAEKVCYGETCVNVKDSSTTFSSVKDLAGIAYVKLSDKKSGITGVDIFDVLLETSESKIAETCNAIDPGASNSFYSKLRSSSRNNVCFCDAGAEKYAILNPEKTTFSPLNTICNDRLKGSLRDCGTSEEQMGKYELDPRDVLECDCLGKFGHAQPEDLGVKAFMAYQDEGQAACKIVYEKWFRETYGPPPYPPEANDAGLPEHVKQYSVANCRPSKASSDEDDLLVKPYVCQTGKKISVNSAAVNNFRLPENFRGLKGTAKEYISGFGDPTYLTYFQSFPPGEDTAWKSFSSWWQGIGTVVLWAIPVGHVFKPVWGVGEGIFKGLKNALLHPAKTTKAASGLLGEAWKKFQAKQSVSGIRKALNQEDILLIKEGASLTTKSGIFKKFYTNRLNSQIVKEYGTFERYVNDIDPKLLEIVTEPGFKTTDKFVLRLEKAFNTVAGLGGDLEKHIAEDTMDLYKYLSEPAKRRVIAPVLQAVKYETLEETMKKVGIVTLSAYFLARGECEETKATGYPENLVFQKSLSCSENNIKKFKLEGQDYSYYDGLLSGKKFVAIQKGWYGAGIGNDPIDFYAASPCYGDISVERSTITCEKYSMNHKTGKVECEKPKFVDKGDEGEYIACGTPFSKERTFQELLKMLKGKKTRLFKYHEGEPPLLGRITIPIALEKGNYEVNKYELADIIPLPSCQQLYTLPGGTVAPPGGYNLNDMACYKATVFKDGEKIGVISSSDEFDSFVCSRANLYFSNNIKPAFYALTGNALLEKVGNLKIGSTYCAINSLILLPGLVDLLSNGQINDLNSPGEDGKLYSLFLSFDNTVVLFKDDDEDGNWNSFSFTETNLEQLTHVTDIDYDGNIDSVIARGLKGGICKIPGIKIGIKKKDNVETNFCLQKKSLGKQIANMLLLPATIAFDSYLAAQSAGIGALLFAGLAQGAAAYLVSNEIGEWPSG